MQYSVFRSGFRIGFSSRIFPQLPKWFAQICLNLVRLYFAMVHSHNETMKHFLFMSLSIFLCEPNFAHASPESIAVVGAAKKVSCGKRLKDGQLYQVDLDVKKTIHGAPVKNLVFYFKISNRQTKETDYVSMLSGDEAELRLQKSDDKWMLLSSADKKAMLASAGMLPKCRTSKIRRP